MGPKGDSRLFRRARKGSELAADAGEVRARRQPRPRVCSAETNRNRLDDAFCSPPLSASPLVAARGVSDLVLEA